MGRIVVDEVPDDIEFDEWESIIDAELKPLVDARDDVAMLAWIGRRYPYWLAKVPTRRRLRFVEGFYRGFDGRV